MSVANPSRDDFASMLEDSFSEGHSGEGQVVKGLITAIEKDMAIIDVGLKVEGRVPLKEFGVKGKDGVAGFYDANIAANQLTITCEETFPSSSPDEVAHILLLHSKFEGGMTSEVRGVFTYRVNEAGLIANMRGYWNLDMMKFGQED